MHDWCQRHFQILQFLTFFILSVILVVMHAVLYYIIKIKNIMTLYIILL